MIDFDALVLGPLMGTFARPIIVTPIASQPGQPAYEARGVYKVQNPDIQLEDGSIYSASQQMLGVRLSEFSVPAQPQDQVAIPAYMSMPDLGSFVINDNDDDGNGGSTWLLSRIDEAS